VADHDFSQNQRFDAKLIALPEDERRIITNDFNLNKSPSCREKILNVNELQMPETVVLPRSHDGEDHSRRQEPGQGVAYLDDGR